MVTLPDNRIELILMSDQPSSVHLWAKSTTELARRYEFDKEKSNKLLAASAVFLVLMFLFFREATALLLLSAVMVLFPLWLVELVGWFRGPRT